MGAGGRDFHNFNVVFRDNSYCEVHAFTAAQIPYTERRNYPAELSGVLYPDGIPIYPEEELGMLISKNKIDQVVFSYSDISHEHLMNRASLCLSLGADFILLGPEKTMLKSSIPVISICAVRTGCGKSIITRKIAGIFREKGVKTSVIRHPMVYCDFTPVKRFSTLEDIDRQACTIEEREEFEPLVEKGITVYSGVDYRMVLEEAEENSQVIIWDGGNNDFPFIIPCMEIVLLDALRPGHEMLFYPGEVNLKRGEILIITKVNEAKKSKIQSIKRTIRDENPNAKVLEAPSMLNISNHELIKGKKKALVIEDGPTITHGNMPHGAGVAASKNIVSAFVDPRPYAVGSIKETYEKYPHIGPVLPAMGYSAVQIKELEETISLTLADIVVIATPFNLQRLIKIDKPVVRVSYDFDIDLTWVVESFIEKYVR